MQTQAHAQQEHGPVLKLIVATAVIILIAVSVYFIVSGSNVGHAATNATVVNSAVKAQQTQLQHVSAELNRSMNGNYLIEYSVSFPVASSGSLGSYLSNTTLDVEKLGNLSKLAVDIPDLLTLGVYSNPSTKYQISCTQFSPLFSAVSAGVLCSAVLPQNSTTSILTNRKFFDAINATLNKNLVFVGNQSVLGRPCQEYSININASEGAAIGTNILTAADSSSSAFVGGGLFGGGNITARGDAYRVGFCIDSAEGYLSKVNVSVSNYSAILNRNITNQIISLEATSYSRSPNASDFEIPASFAQLNLTCISNNKLEFSFLSLVDSKNTTIKILNLTVYNSTSLLYGEKNLTLSTGTQSLQAYQVYNVTGNVSNLYAFESPRACVDGECQTAASDTGLLACYSYVAQTAYNTTTAVANESQSTTVQPGAIDDTLWYMTGTDPEGYTNIGVNIKPYYNTFSANQSYYYALDLQSFENATTGAYAGLQTNGIINGKAVGKMLIFSVWNATGGVSAPGGTGQTFSGEGTGYSERVPYDWQGGHSYRLDIYLKNTSGYENMWGASVTDISTGQTQQIGWIYVPVSYGNLTSPITFQEMYKNYPAATCYGISPSEVSFTNMSADSGEYKAAYWEPYYVENITGCSNYLWVQNTAGGYISAAGVNKT